MTSTKTVGSKREVWNGTAKKTPGGLTKSKLMVNKYGKVISKAKHRLAIKNNIIANIMPKSKSRKSKRKSRK